MVYPKALAFKGINVFDYTQNLKKAHLSKKNYF
jgi:hypothetical protein